VDTNTLYLVLGGLVAIVLLTGLLKSDWFKAKLTRKGLKVESGNYAKTVTTISNIKNKADVNLEQDIVENHNSETNVSDVDNAKVKHKLKKADD